MQKEALPPLAGTAAAMLVHPAGQHPASPREAQPARGQASCKARRGSIFKGFSTRQTVPVLQFTLPFAASNGF